MTSSISPRKLLPAGVHPHVSEELQKRRGLIREFTSQTSRKSSRNFSEFSKKNCHCITQMRDTLIRNFSQSFTAFLLLLEQDCWKQHLKTSMVRYKMGFWRSCCHMIIENENWEWRVSPRYDFPFLF